MISRNSFGGAYPLKRLDEVVEFLDSKRRPVTESYRSAGPYPYFGANGQQGTIDDYIFDEPLVLLAEDGGHFGEPERGIAYRISGKTWVNNHAHVLRPKSNIDLGYLCRVLEHYDVTPFVTGTTRGKLTQAGASEILIPLPPLAEQRRIAEILDRSDALRARRRTVLAQLDTLTQSIFIDTFGDPAMNPKGWPVMALGDVVREKPNNGIFRKNPEYEQDDTKGIPVVWVEELFRGSSIDTKESRRVVPTKAEASKYGLHYGDVLFCRSSLKLDGIAFNNVYLGQDNAALFECHLIRVQPNMSIVSPIYLNCLLRLPQMRAIAKSKSKTATMTTIDQTALCSIFVMLPLFALQQDFARRVAAVDKLKAGHRASLVEMEALFASLQHRAFRGEL